MNDLALPSAETALPLSLIELQTRLALVRMMVASAQYKDALAGVATLGPECIDLCRASGVRALLLQLIEMSEATLAIMHREFPQLMTTEPQPQKTL